MERTASYKLIKKLPDSIEVGTIESFFGDHSTPNWKGTNYYEANSEYWEKVEEKEYKILEYVIIDGTFRGARTSKIENTGLLGNEFEIYSVKRISDNEIFTVGEEISRVSGFGALLKINSFTEENNGKLWVDFSDVNSGGATYLENIKKIVKVKYPIINNFIQAENPNNIYRYNNGFYAYKISLDLMMHSGNCVDNGYFYIGEVAISETVTLKIGDKVEYIGNPETKNSVPYFIIDNFYYRIDGIILCRSKDNLIVEDVMTVSIYEEPKLSFLTEDGVTIYEYDIAYWVTNDIFEWIYLYDLQVCRMHKDILGENSTFKIFSTKNAAELFCLKEKMLTSFKEWNNNVSEYENKLKENVNK